MDMPKKAELSTYLTLMIHHEMSELYESNVKIASAKTVSTAQTLGLPLGVLIWTRCPRW